MKLLATCLSALALLVAAPVATAATEAATPAKPAPAAAGTKAEDKGPSAAERRAASSEFEAEELDGSAFAEEEGSGNEEEEPAEKGGGAGSVGRAIFGLIVVLAAIFGIHWLLKKWGASRLEGAAGKAGIIDVVATTNLAQGRALHVVRVGDELVLVGATEQSITRIGELDASSFQGVAGDRGNGEFQAMLSGAMVGGQPGVPAGMGGAGSANQPFIRRFLDNLRMSTAR